MATVLGLKLPETATAPFCPSEVEGSIAVPQGAPLGTRLARFVGPGLLVAVGYMDPGNWATDIAAGSGYGFDLLFVVVRPVSLRSCCNRWRSSSAWHPASISRRPVGAATAGFPISRSG